MMHFSALLLPVLISVLLIVASPPYKYPGLDFFYPPLPLPVDVVHQFPVGTWIDNLAVRSNGKILATALSTPELYQVDNRGKKPVKLIHTFANATGCTGITKLGRDTFYVIAGSFNFGNLTGVPGSWSVYKVDLRPPHPKKQPARVSLVANFPDAIMLNGIAVLSNRKKWLLVSDSAAGIVYRLEAKHGRVVKVLHDTLMKPDSDSGVGVNGLKFYNNYLYFTNTDRGILVRKLIHHNGRSRAAAMVVAHVNGADGFAINKAHNVVVAQNGIDALGRVTESTLVTLAGGSWDGRTNVTHADPEKSKLYGPTAVRFGKVKPFFMGSKADWMKAYVSTNGGTAQYKSGSPTRGGTISVVNVRGYW